MLIGIQGLRGQLFDSLEVIMELNTHWACSEHHFFLFLRALNVHMLKHSQMFLKIILQMILKNHLRVIFIHLLLMLIIFKYRPNQIITFVFFIEDENLFL